LSKGAEGTCFPKAELQAASSLASYAFAFFAFFFFFAMVASSVIGFLEMPKEEFIPIGTAQCEKRVASLTLARDLRLRLLRLLLLLRHDRSLVC